MELVLAGIWEYEGEGETTVTVDRVVNEGTEDAIDIAVGVEGGGGETMVPVISLFEEASKMLLWDAPKRSWHVFFSLTVKLELVNWV